MPEVEKCGFEAYCLELGFVSCASTENADIRLCRIRPAVETIYGDKRKMAVFKEEYLKLLVQIGDFGSICEECGPEAKAALRHYS